MTEEKYYNGMSIVATLLMLALAIAMLCCSCLTPHEAAMEKAAEEMKLPYSYNIRISHVNNIMQLHFENYKENINNISYVLQRSYDSRNWVNIITVRARQYPGTYDVNVQQGYGYYRLVTNLQTQVIYSKMIYVQ